MLVFQSISLSMSLEDMDFTFLELWSLGKARILKKGQWVSKIMEIHQFKEEVEYAFNNGYLKVDCT